MYKNIGSYSVSIERHCWICNICHKASFTKKIKHKCNQASHFHGSETSIELNNLTVNEREKITKVLTSIQNKRKNDKIHKTSVKTK